MLFMRLRLRLLAVSVIHNNRIKVAVAGQDPVPSALCIWWGGGHGCGAFWVHKSSADNKVVNNIHLIKENKAKAIALWE